MSPSPLFSQPTLPTLPSEQTWQNLQHCFNVWQAEGLSSGPASLVQLLAAGQPWVECSLTTVGQRHSLLADLGQLLPGFQRAISELVKLPDSAEMFAIWMDSLALRLLKSEAEEQIVSIHIPNAPWHGFRRRFNLLGRPERQRLLQTLPTTSQAPKIPVESLAPDAQWVELWESVSSGIPADSMPTEWHRFLPADDDEELGCPNIILSRESKQHSLEPLGRWLFRAAAVQEKSRTDAGNFELFLPSWVIPKRPDLLLKELDGVVDRLGGLPGEEQLQEILGSLRHHYNPFEDSIIAAPNTREILALAREWGGKDAHIEGLAGISSLRSGNADEARMAYSRLLNRATNRKDVALALANLGGLDLVTPEGMRNAEPMLREALKLNPWSGVAKRSMEVLESRSGQILNSRGEIL
jgi:tetratricopeptide (TPR) repeat protein